MSRQILVPNPQVGPVIRDTAAGIEHPFPFRSMNVPRRRIRINAAAPRPRPFPCGQIGNPSCGSASSSPWSDERETPEKPDRLRNGHLGLQQGDR